jgi:threonine synthase
VRFVSTRNNKEQVSFSQAILHCIAPDGGLYVPAYTENLSPWIMYMDNTTSFSSIAGSLTSALIKEEFSPIICEAIASKAFPFSPKIKKIDERLYIMELYHGPTGTNKDFGVSYLASCLEHILLMQEKQAIVLAVTEGDTGSCIAAAFRDKKHLKSVLLYSKGSMRGFKESDCVWNGGNIYPVEVDGDIEACYKLARAIYSDTTLVEKYGLTLANTVNIGRLLPHSFLYMYAFSQLKNQEYGDLYYTLPATNYGNLVAGLYSWKFSLPVNGFVTNSTPSVIVDPFGECSILDSMVPLSSRGPADPVNPSNIERLEEVFTTNPAVLKGLVYPANVTETEQREAFKKLFVDYKEFVDPLTAKAYAAALKRNALTSEDDGVTLLLAEDHPGLYADTLKHWCGEAPELPPELIEICKPIIPEKRISCDTDSLIAILDEIK